MTVSLFAILGSIAYAFTHDVKQFILDGLGTVDASAAAAIAVRNFRKGNIAFHAKHNIRPTCIVIGWIKSEALSIIINGLAIDIESEFRERGKQQHCRIWRQIVNSHQFVSTAGTCKAIGSDKGTVKAAMVVIPTAFIVSYDEMQASTVDECSGCVTE